MLDPELLSGLTPENLSGLEPAQKQRVIEILRDLELTGYQRYMRNFRAKIEALHKQIGTQGTDYWRDRERRGLPSLGEMLRRAENNPERKPSLLDQLENAPDEVARRERLARESKAALDAEIQRARQERIAAEGERGIWAEPDPEPSPVGNTIPLEACVRETVRRREEEAQAAKNPDYIDRICGEGSDKPSGKSGRYGFMG